MSGEIHFSASQSPYNKNSGKQLSSYHSVCTLSSGNELSSYHSICTLRVTCWRSPRTLKMSTGKWVWASYSPCTMSAGYRHVSIIVHAPRMLSYHCSLSHDCFWDTVISLPHYMHNKLCVTVMSQPHYINYETEIHMSVTHSTCSMSAELQP